MQSPNHWTAREFSLLVFLLGSCIGKRKWWEMDCLWAITFKFCIQWKWKWKSLSHVRLFATPWTTQSMEFSRPEYWSGYPFPSPGDLPNPGIEPRSPTLQVDSLTAEPQGKPKHTGVGRLSLFPQISLTQESNWGLPHCRRILYQLSYQGSHIFEMVVYDLKYCSIVMFSNMWSLNICKWAFQVALVAKNTLCQCRRHKRCGFDPWVRKIPWRKAWQPTSILPWRIPWKEEPGGLWSIGSQRVGHD